MACGCKMKNGGTNQIDLPEDFSKPPLEFCAFCADKHFSTAWTLAKETGYEQVNRRWVVGELVLMQWHLNKDYPDFCKKVREIRHRWQVGDWRGAEKLWEPLGAELDKILQKEAEKEGKKNTYDVFIPFKAGASAAMDQELRFALRSIEKHLKNYNNIWLAGTSKPDWLTGVNFVKVKDDRGGKQMNIHDAIKAVFNQPGCAENLIFWADDNAVIQDVDALKFPVVATENNMIDYDQNGKWWYRTLKTTGDLLKSHGFPTLSYEAHTPVVFNKEKYLQLDQEFNFYGYPVGLCYISMYYNRYRIPATHKQANVKATFQGKADKAALVGKTFIGYNNGGVEGGVLDILRERFPMPSKYEKATSTEPVYSDNPTMGVVLGTYDRPDLVELQLHYLCRINHLPVLVHDDASPKQEEVKAVVEKFKTEGHDVEFATTDSTKGHKPGDLCAFAAGLKWAKNRGYDLLYKISHRWLIKREWVSDAIALAKDTDGLTFSSYTTCYNKGFRTEFMGMNVNVWHNYLDDIIRKSNNSFSGLVEAYIHAIAKIIAGKANQKCYEKMTMQKMDADKQGYIMIPWMGTDRKNPPDDILWHDVHSDKFYQDELQKVTK